MSAGPRIAVIGHGAIGSAVVAGLIARGCEVVVLLRHGSRRRATLPHGVGLLGDMGELVGDQPALVVEAAGHEAVRSLVPLALRAGLTTLISSVGALHDAALLEELRAAALSSGARIILPSGAVAGLDYLRAARHAEGVSVRYTSRKPPAAWADELAARGFSPDHGQPLSLYEGDAQGAASRFPANLNVAATLALAGIGMERTQVNALVDPAATGNSHEIAVTSALGHLQLRAGNRASPDNPKTSAIVACSILAAIDQHFSPIQFL